MREQFLVEVGDGEEIAGLAEMNRLFQAWLETAYHRAVQLMVSAGCSFC